MLIQLLYLLSGLTIGFIWGRQSGRAEGMQYGRASAPLELRAQALQGGACPVCGRELPASTGYTPVNE